MIIPDYSDGACRPSSIENGRPWATVVISGATRIHEHHEHVGPGYLTPQAAIEESEPEEIAYVTGIHTGMDVDALELVEVNGLYVPARRVAFF